MISGAVSRPQAISLAFQGTLALLVMILLSLVNISGASWTVSLTALPMIAIYLWPFRAHYVWSIWAVVLLGLLLDSLTGGPLGLWALVNFILFIMIEPQARRPGGTLFGHWLQFCIFSAIAMVAALMLGRISMGQWPSIPLLAGQACVSILLFPVFCRLVSITDYRRRDERDARAG